MTDSLLDALMAQLTQLPPDEIKQIEKQTVATTQGRKWIYNAGPQEEAYFSKADVLFYGGSGGGGKLQSLSSKILTPMGWTTMGDLTVGSIVSDPTTGGHCRVIAVHKHGVMPIYRVTCDDGASTEVGLDHLWAYHIANHVRPRSKHSDQRRYAQSVLGSPEPRDRWHNFRVGTTSALIEMIKDGKGPRIPLCEPILFTVNGRAGHGEMPPYLAGILLGDGHHGTVTVTSCDDEVRSYLLDLGFSARNDFHSDGKSKAYGATGRIKKTADAWLRNHGLKTCRSWEKFIPNYVYTADLKYRIEFLRGLLDTDGTVDDRGHVSFTSTSERLARGVMDLVRGFGGKATITDRIPTYDYQDEKCDGRIAYTIYIWLPNASAFFQIERKKRRCTWSWNGGAENMRAIRSIEYVRDDEARCITVDSPYGLYVTDDYIVTHNSDLLVGLALTDHVESLLMRKTYGELKSLTERAIKVNGTRRGFNGAIPPTLRTADGRTIEFGGASHFGKEQAWQGRAHDLLGIDEVVYLAEFQVRFLMGWVRSSAEGQRSRSVFASNPPVHDEGQWIIGMFRPWLDLTHHKPAKDGELRWYITDSEGKDYEVDGPELVQRDGDTFIPSSRTFIRASLKDNPYLLRTNYQKQLDALPEPFRSAVRDGNFMAVKKDADNQVIPLAWIIAAQDRWTDRPPDGVTMTAMGVDVAQGGSDESSLAARYGGWYAPLVNRPGKETPNGSTMAALIVEHRRDGCPVIVDVGGGYGGATVERLEDNSISVKKFNGAEASTGRARDGSGRIFINKRAEAYWRFREQLDPDQVGGSVIALPPDPQMRSDLAAPRFIPDILKIQIEDKQEIKKRIGRSPDRGDAVVMALDEGQKAAIRQKRRGPFGPYRELSGHANVGYSNIKNYGNRSGVTYQQNDGPRHPNDD